MKKPSGWSVFDNNPFTEGFLEWMDSPDGQLSDEVRELAWQSLQNVDVDASHRKLVWHDGKRLSIDESVQRIHREYPEFPLDLIEDTSSDGWKWTSPQKAIPKSNWMSWTG